jgi:phosphate transport system substrate-binding protein
LVGTSKAGVFDKYNGTQASSTGNQAADTPPFGLTALGCETTPDSTSVAADSVHPALSYSTTGNACAANLSTVPQPWLFPAGSSAGINCFVDDQGAGNIAFARSSRGRKTSDPANLEFWAFALDAVTWTRNSANTFAPANLSPAQINQIYTCAVTDWSQVGGQPGAITRYYPQTGSGTGSFFASLYLNGVYPTSTASCPITFVPENDGTQINPGDLSTAILPYSFAVYTAQTNTTETNLTKGQKLQAVNGVKPSFTTVSEQAAVNNVTGNACTSNPAPGFCGSRYVYHVTWQLALAQGGFGLPAAYYSAAIDLIGVAPGGVIGKHSVCAATSTGAEKYASTLKKYGFKPLATGTTAQSTAWQGGVPGNSNCREF